MKTSSPQGLQITYQASFAEVFDGSRSEVAEFLVEQGIDSLSLNSDAVMKTTVTFLEVERRLGAKR